jgi:putative mycofactocin binding protein MftB
MACAASTDQSLSTVPNSAVPTPCLAERSLNLHPQVALRPEPFGALAYHYDTRRLVFIKHPDMVRLLRSLADHSSLGEALDSCDIHSSRRPTFERSISQLLESGIVCDRAH